MQRGKGSCVLLMLVALALAFPLAVLAQQQQNTAVADFAYVPDPVLVTPSLEQERGSEPSQALIEWRAQILDKVNREPGPEWRPPIRFQGEEPEFVPPTAPPSHESAADKATDPEDYVEVIRHGFTTGENPSVSNVAEPSVAAAQKKKLFMTTNWSAAKSSDHGRNWTYINPSTYFTPPSGMVFCCDQEVAFDPTYNFFIWSILYITPDEKGGCIRLACSKNLTNWWVYDFAYNTTKLPDYPHIRLSRNFLYLTYNEFAPSFTQSFLLRLPLQFMVLAKSFGYRYFSRSDIFNLTVAYGMRTNSTMYAATNSLGNVRVYEWKESSNGYSWHDVSVASWTGTLDCPCPDGHDPCGRVGTRILGAVASYNDNFPDSCKNQLWLFWNAGKDGSHSYPYVYGVKICLNDWSRIGYAHTWNSGYAWQYPAIAVNPRGDICYTVDLLGGSSHYTEHYNSIIDEYSGYTPGWEMHWVATGSACPSDNKWGDYQSAGTWWRNSLQCISIGHVRQSSRSQNFYSRFTRHRDE